MTCCFCLFPWCTYYVYISPGFFTVLLNDMSLLFCFHNVRVRTMYISAHQINHIFLSAGRVLKELPQWRAGQTFIYKCKHKQQTKQVETTKNETETMINSTTFNADNNNLQWLCISCYGFRHQLCYVRFPWIMQGLNPCVCFVNELIIISDDWGSIQNDNGLVTNCESIHTFILFVKKFATLAMWLFNILFLMALDLLQREKNQCKISKWFEKSSVILFKR